MSTRKFFAVRIVVVDHNDNGTLFTCDYVRGEMRVGKQAFLAYALGDFLLMLDLGDHKVSFLWSEIDFETARQNRLFHHTSH